MQEDLEQRTVSVSIQTAKLSGRVLRSAIAAVLRKMEQERTTDVYKRQEYTIHEKPVNAEKQAFTPKRENPRQVNPGQAKPEQAEPEQENPAPVSYTHLRRCKSVSGYERAVNPIGRGRNSHISVL